MLMQCESEVALTSQQGHNRSVYEGSPHMMPGLLRGALSRTHPALDNAQFVWFFLASADLDCWVQPLKQAAARDAWPPSSRERTPTEPLESPGTVRAFHVVTTELVHASITQLRPSTDAIC